MSQNKLIAGGLMAVGVGLIFVGWKKFKAA